MPAGHKCIPIEEYAVRHLMMSTENSRDYYHFIYPYSEGSYVGLMGFYSDNYLIEHKLVSELLVESPIWFLLAYEIDRYQEIIETLRYEKPVYIHLDWRDDRTISFAELGTNEEPIGEQEGIPCIPA